MLNRETQYISKTELIRKLISAWRESDFDFSKWTHEQMEQLAEVTITALNRAA